MANIPPIIKWFGSKRIVASMLSQKFPDFDRYFEPFVGGGALLPYSALHEAYAADIIPELIELWNMIKLHPATVADEYRTRWEKLQKEGLGVYYEIRDKFNQTKNCLDFLFLTRTCVNGMIRYNANGEFNNSFHLSRPGINPLSLKKQLYQWSDYISRVTFVNADYRECLQAVRNNDFVFLDPPYGGTKDRYTKKEFNLGNLFDELERLNRIGAKWMMTFDGEAGERKYNFAPPKELYRSSFLMSTGLSSFKKTMEKKKDSITESVYLNF